MEDASICIDSSHSEISLDCLVGGDCVLIVLDTRTGIECTRMGEDSDNGVFNGPPLPNLVCAGISPGVTHHFRHGDFVSFGEHSSGSCVERAG